MSDDTELDARLNRLRDATQGMRLSPQGMVRLVNRLDAQVGQASWWRALWTTGRFAFALAAAVPIIVAVLAVQEYESQQELETEMALQELDP